MAIGKEVIRNGVNIIAPFRRDASKNGYGVEISPVRQNALERLLRTRVIDRSIGEGDIPFPIVPGNYLDGASENAIIDVLDVTVRHKLPIDSVRNPVFVIDDDLGSIMDNLSKHYQNGEKPSIAILVDRERGVGWEAALSAGAREAFLIEEPMAAAVGEDISVFMPTGARVVDIGGGTTEIAVISLGGIVVSKSLRIAGDEMNEAITHYIRLRHGLLIGEKTAEDLKIKIGSAYKKPQKANYKNQTEGDKEYLGSEKEHDKMAVIRGRDIETGLPKSLRMTEVEVREALSPVIAQIIDGIVDVLEESPPELTSDILEHGILLTGGGSILPGLDHLIIERTHIPVIRSDDPLTTVVRGTGKVLEDDSLLQRVKVIGGLK